jgi:hypothetical protein
MAYVIYVGVYVASSLLMGTGGCGEPEIMRQSQCAALCNIAERAGGAPSMGWWGWVKENGVRSNGRVRLGGGGGAIVGKREIRHQRIEIYRLWPAPTSTVRGSSSSG